MLHDKAEHKFHVMSDSLHDNFKPWIIEILYIALFLELETEMVL